MRTEDISFRRVLRALRIRAEAEKKGCCPECGRKLPKKKPTEVNSGERP